MVDRLDLVRQMIARSVETSSAIAKSGHGSEVQTRFSEAAFLWGLTTSGRVLFLRSSCRAETTAPAGPSQTGNEPAVVQNFRPHRRYSFERPSYSQRGSATGSNKQSVPSAA